MIKSFACKETKKIFMGDHSKRFSKRVQEHGNDCMTALHAAPNLQAIEVVPGMRLKKMTGPWAGWFSIRINKQWRIAFHWKDGNAYDVQIIDYHR